MLVSAPTSHPRLITGLSDRLRTRYGWTVDCVDNVPDALRHAASWRPGVALIGLDDAQTERLDAIPAFGIIDPRLRIGVVGSPGSRYVQDALRAGAHAVLDRHDDPLAFTAAVLALQSGWSLFPQDWVAAVDPAPDGAGDDVISRVRRLTDEQVQLLRSLARGTSISRIAGDAYLSERTVKRMIAALLRELGVANRMQAAALAGRAGLVAAPVAQPGTRQAVLTA